MHWQGQASEHRQNLQQLDSCSDLEIKKLVIQACRKTVNLDGKAPAYLDAMFDTIVDEQVKKTVNVDNVAYADFKNDSSSNDLIKARQKMMNEMKQAHKGGK